MARTVCFSPLRDWAWLKCRIFCVARCRDHDAPARRLNGLVRGEGAVETGDSKDLRRLHPSAFSCLQLEGFRGGSKRQVKVVKLALLGEGGPEIAS